MRRTDHRSLGLAAMVAVVVTFSFGSTIVRKAGAPGYTIAFWRVVGSAVVWNVLLRVREHRFLDIAELRRSVPTGLIFGVNIALFYTAAVKTSIANTEFIGALAPIVLIPAGAMLFHEHLHPRMLAYGAVALAGLAIVLFNAPPRGAATWTGNVIAIVAMFTWSTYLIASRKLRTSMSVVALMASVLPIAAATILPFVVARGELFSIPARGWPYVVILMLLTGVVAHGLIVFAQRHVPVGTIGLMQIGQPALAAVWATVFLDQRVRGVQIVGMVVALLGLAAIVVHSQRAAARVTAIENGELAGTAG